MKVCHILYSGLGGHGSVVFSIVDGDSNRCLKQSMIFYGVEEPRKEYLLKCQQHEIAAYSVKKRRGVDIRSYFKVYNALRRDNPEVILLHSVNLIIVGLCYKIFKGCKLVVVEHNANQIKRKSEWLWSVLSLVFANRLIYLSPQYKDEIKEKIPFFYYERKISIIENGIDLNRFRKANFNFRRELNLVMQSRFSASSKDHETLIHAFNQLTKKVPEEYKLKLYLAGDGENKKNIELLVGILDMKESVIFSGMLNEEALLDLLEDADIYVHSSIAETMSTAIMQAMASGLPIVATDIPGINNLINDDKDGVLFEAKDCNELSNKLYDLILEPSKRQRLGEQARKTAERRFSNRSMFNKYYELIQEVVS
jgi:L-malate glycosyltransferase